MLYNVISPNTLLSNIGSKLALVGIISVLTACGGGGFEDEAASEAISADTAPAQSTVADPSGGGNQAGTSSINEILASGVIHTPTPDQFQVGSAVAPVENSMTAWMFNDVVKTASLKNEQGVVQASVWTPRILGESRTDLAGEVVVDKNGWPMNMLLSNGERAEVLSITLLNSSLDNAYQAGIYTLTYVGSGEIAVTNVEVQAQTAGQMTLRYSGSGPINIEIYATDLDNSGNYLRNIKLLRPAADIDEIFSQTYIDHLSQFSVIRPVHMLSNELLYGMKDKFGGYSHSQGNSAWANRVQFESASWGSAKGVPYEVIAQLANQSQSDLWLNIPLAADDNYVRELAELMLLKLDTGRAVYIELGNALWNLTFPYAVGRDYAFKQAQLRWPHLSLYESTEYLADKVTEDNLVASWYAARTQEVARIFKDVWSTHATRVAVVMTGEIGRDKASVDLNREILEASIYVHEDGADVPAMNIDVFAVSMKIVDPFQYGEYVTENGFDRTSTTSYITEAINYVDGTDRFFANASKPGLRYLVRHNVNLTAEFNLPLVAYEGGHDFVGSMFTAEQVEKSQEMYDLYNAFYEMWQQESGALIINANYIADNSNDQTCANSTSIIGQPAGLKTIQQQSEATAPVFRAIKEIAASAG